MAASCTHPLDLTKVWDISSVPRSFKYETLFCRRMQTFVKAHPGSFNVSMLSVMRLAIEEAGIRSLYTGLTASLMRQMSYSLVRIGIYEDLKRILRQRGQASSLNLLCAAGIAGAIGGIAGNPAGHLLYCTLLPRAWMNLARCCRYSSGTNDNWYYAPVDISV